MAEFLLRPRALCAKDAAAYLGLSESHFRRVAAVPIQMSRDGHDVVISIHDVGEFATVHSESLRDLVVRAIRGGHKAGRRGMARSTRSVSIPMTREEEVAVRSFLKDIRAQKKTASPNGEAAN